VLRGQSGVVIEFNSVPPPQSGDTPIPVSSTAGVVSAVPSSLGSPPPLRTSTPTTLSAADHSEFRPKRRGLVAGGVIAVSAALGVGLGLRAIGGASTAPAAAVTAPPAAPTVAAANARPSSAPPRVAPVPAAGTGHAQPETAEATAGADSDGGALTLTAPHATATLTAAQRAKLARAQRAAADKAAREAAAAASVSKPKPSKRLGLDDAEPDVGY
jgi:hypothetical protein